MTRERTTTLSRFRQAAGKGLALLVGILVTAGVVEVGVRLFADLLGVSPYMQYDELLGWKALPNTTKRHKSASFGFDVEYHINPLGYRGSAYPREKPGNVRRVAVLGDSNGFGWGIPEGQQFAALLGADLRDVQVFNLSLSGYGTDQEYLRFVREGMSLRPDVVVLQLTPNDFEEIQYPFFNQKPKPQFILSTNDTVSLVNVPVRAVGAKAAEYASRSLPMPFRDWTEWHSYSYNLINERYVAFNQRFRHVATEPTKPIFSPESFRIFNLIVAQLERKLGEAGARGLIIHASKELHDRRSMFDVGLPIIDMYPAFESLKNRGTDPWFQDGYHWNVFGHRLIADRLSEAVRETGSF
jgi:lysophospholipase L1-like esterase